MSEQLAYYIFNQLAEARHDRKYDVFFSLIPANWFGGIKWEHAGPYRLPPGVIPESWAAKPIWNGNTPLHIFLNSDPLCYKEDHKQWLEDIICRKRGIDILLAHGANVNAPGYKGWSPLICAVEKSDLAIVEHLLKRGADMRYAPPDQLNSIQRARAKGTRYGDSPHTGLLSIAKVFMLHGAKPSEFTVKRTGRKPTFYATQEMSNFYEQIVKTRATLIVFLGLGKKSPLLRVVGRDILRYLAKLVYQTRGDSIWEPPVKQRRKRLAP